MLSVPQVSEPFTIKEPSSYRLDPSITFSVCNNVGIVMDESKRVSLKDF